MTDPVQKPEFNINKCVDDFASGVGDGRKMAVAFATGMDHVTAERDTTGIVRMIQRALKRGDAKSASIVRVTFAAIFVGAKPTLKGKEIVGLRIKDATIDSGAVDAMHDLVDDKVSMRGPKWAAAFKPELDAKEFNAITAADRFVKANPTAASLEAFIAALQAKRSVVTSTTVVDAPVVSHVVDTRNVDGMPTVTPTTNAPPAMQFEQAAA